MARIASLGCIGKATANGQSVKWTVSKFFCFLFSLGIKASKIDHAWKLVATPVQSLRKMS